MKKQILRDHVRISTDLWSANLGFHQVGRVIDLAANYALESEPGQSTNDYAETIYSILAAAAALQRETLLKVGKIEDELRTGDAGKT